ncbi:MAG: electron transfer flavoprotein beta subunit/FixA family protein [Spirochaetes bacterium]|nr:MAG: electron transfer flavoprotein beta subunit/FixA family protein [Spirochaetota bacterium]
MLSIIVCIKQVPDTHRASFDPKTGVLDRASAENITNPDDLHAIEAALALRDACGGSVTAISMGPPQASDVLAEAYALGVDRCVLVSGPCFAGSDSLVTSKILARAITKLGAFDVVVTGFEAIDGNTAHVGYQLSEFLGIPHVTQVHDIRIEDGHAIVERLYGHEYQKIRVALPLLVSAGRNANRVRAPRLADLKNCTGREIAVMGLSDIGGSADEYGAAGSPTMVIGTELFTHARGREALPGTLDEKIEGLIHKLKKHNLLRN